AKAWWASKLVTVNATFATLLRVNRSRMPIAASWPISGIVFAWATILVSNFRLSFSSLAFTRSTAVSRQVWITPTIVGTTSDQDRMRSASSGAIAQLIAFRARDAWP